MAEASQSVRAVARYVRVSPQKARLVVDLIRGLRAEEALHRLRFTPKRIAADIAKLLQSAIANAADRAELGLDVDSLYVTRAVVNDGPRQKRVRPAPMGRAYRVQRRSSHIELYVGAKPSGPGSASLARRPKAELEAGPEVPAAPPARKQPAARKPAAKKPAAKKPAAPKAKKPAAPKTAAKKPAKTTE